MQSGKTFVAFECVHGHQDMKESRVEPHMLQDLKINSFELFGQCV